MPKLADTVDKRTKLDGGELLNRAIEAYYSDVVKAVARRSRTQQNALDVVHDLYVKLAARPDVLHDKRSIKAFLCRAAVNLAVDRRRREQREARLFCATEHEACNVASEAAPAGHALEVEARIRILRQAIGELPLRRRAVFILHQLHQKTPDEIASSLRISRNMVNRHLRRALAHCLDRLVELG